MLTPRGDDMAGLNPEPSCCMSHILLVDIYPDGSCGQFR